MNARTAVVAFTAGVSALAAAAYGVGSAVGPVGSSSAAHTDGHGASRPGEAVAGAGHDAAHGAGEMGGAAGPATSPLPGGLMVSQDGYTFDLHRVITSPGRGKVVEFSITGPDGERVTDYDVEHDKRLHLIAVRRDFTGFQHVHPVLDDAGTWSVPLDLQAGQWRLFADFIPTQGQALTLGADLTVTGRVETRAIQPETRSARVGRYTVTLTGTLQPVEDARLTLSVSRDGEPVTDLQPYLGAYGHVVALREGDLAYLHVHPDGTPGDGRTVPGPDVDFFVAVPSRGAYHLYLDFKHDDVVRTATFRMGAASEPVTGQGQDAGHGGGAGDQADHSH